MSQSWAETEDIILKTNYSIKTYQELLILMPNRSQKAVVRRANRLGITKNKKKFLKPLLEENNQAYYWVGFIFADGCLTKQNYLRLGLGGKDLEHLKSFCDFIGTNKKLKFVEKNNGYEYRHGYYLLCIGEKESLDKLRTKFDFKDRKTYNPPERLPDNYELMLSLLIGYIDGDGYINKQTGRKDSFIQLHVHGSWLGILTKFCNKIESHLGVQISKPKIDKRGYAKWVITNSVVITHLKKHIENRDLYVLKRKWDIVDSGFISDSKAIINKKKIINLYKSGMKQIDISKQTGLSVCWVGQICRAQRNQE